MAQIKAPGPGRALKVLQGIGVQAVPVAEHANGQPRCSVLQEYRYKDLVGNDGPQGQRRRLQDVNVPGKAQGDGIEVPFGQAVCKGFLEPWQKCPVLAPQGAVFEALQKGPGSGKGEAVQGNAAPAGGKGFLPDLPAGQETGAQVAVELRALGACRPGQMAEDHMEVPVVDAAPVAKPRHKPGNNHNGRAPRLRAQAVLLPVAPGPLGVSGRPAGIGLACGSAAVPRVFLITGERLSERLPVSLPVSLSGAVLSPCSSPRPVRRPVRGALLQASGFDAEGLLTVRAPGLPGVLSGAPCVSAHVRARLPAFVPSSSVRSCAASGS